MTSVRNGIRVVLLDIEGTTTPIAFVHERLFSYVREHLSAFLDANWDAAEVQAAIKALRAEYLGDRDATGLPVWSNNTPGSAQQSVGAYVRWLMDLDRKSPGLKTLQGLIWKDAYTSGELTGEVFDDVAPAIHRWHEAGLRIAIYSSGSELAQRLLFASTSSGDLTPLIDAFFDTAVGGKKEAQSYRAIAKSLECPSASILFLSDVTAELAAAAEAGCEVLLCMRPGNASQPDADRFQHIVNFSDLRP